MAATNSDIYGRPIESVTDTPVKRDSSEASNNALVSAAETATKLGLQADQAYAGNKLRKELADTTQAYEAVQNYATGISDDLFTGDNDVDAAVRGMVGDLDDVREAVRQGVLLPELGKAKLDLVLKNAKARRPAYADQLNAAASEVLGFNVKGYATRALFHPQQADAPKQSQEEKLREKLYMDAGEYLYGRGMGPEVFNLSQDAMIRTASKLKEADAKQEQLLAEFKIENAVGEQADRWVGRTANAWSYTAVDQVTAGFSAQLANAPIDPTERAQWMRSNIPRAVARLQELRNGLNTQFVESVRVAQGDQAAANMSATVVDSSLKPARERIDQLIADFQDPAMLETLTSSLELGLTAERTRFYDDSPYARSYAALFTEDGRNQALLNSSVFGKISQQHAGVNMAKEFDLYMGFDPGPQANEAEKKTAKVNGMHFQSIMGAASTNGVAGAQAEFDNMLQSGNLPYYTSDVTTPVGKLKAANATALQSLSMIDSLNSGAIREDQIPASVASMKNTVQGMLTHPAQDGASEVASTAQLLNKLNDPKAREAEAKYNFSFNEERAIVQDRLRRSTDDAGSVYLDNVLKNTKNINLRGESITVDPLYSTNFYFDTKNNSVKATLDPKKFNSVVQGLDARDEYFANSVMKSGPALFNGTDNNKSSRYADGVGALFFDTYKQLEAERGSKITAKDIQEDMGLAIQLADTGITKYLGIQDTDYLAKEIEAYTPIFQNNPTARPQEGASEAEVLAYRSVRDQNTQRILSQLDGYGPTARQSAQAMARLYTVGKFRKSVRDGRIVFN